jgi:hypothetical protein
VSVFSEPEDVQVAQGMVNRLAIGLIRSVLALASSILLTVQPRIVGGTVSLITIVGGIGLAFSVLLLLRVSCKSCAWRLTVCRSWFESGRPALSVPTSHGR